MSDLPALTNGRGRIRCYWCKYEMPDETGPWAIVWERNLVGRIPACYGHSDIPYREAIEKLKARAGDRR